MELSIWGSLVPPNHAATRPSGVSTIVEAWQVGVGRPWMGKMNSESTLPFWPSWETGGMEALFACE